MPSIFNCFHPLLSNGPTFMMASAAGRRSKKPLALPSGFQFDIPLLRAVGNAEQAKQVNPNATTVSHAKHHVQDLSASHPLPQTEINKALTFDSLHSRSSSKSWGLRNLSSKLKSRPTPSHNSSNLKLCCRYQQSAKVQTLASPWDSLITMLE